MKLVAHVIRKDLRAVAIVALARQERAASLAAGRRGAGLTPGAGADAGKLVLS